VRVDQNLQSESPERILEVVLPSILGATRLAFHIYHHKVSIEEVEDVSQEIILLLMQDNYRRLFSFDERRSTLNTWLKSVVIHHVRRYLQKRRTEEAIDRIPANRFAYQSTQEQLMILTERRKRLREVLCGLTVREQRLFNLLSEDTLGVEDIAEIMDIQVNSVYRRKHALIKKLRSLMEGYL
jgi:RNA polymerase sigma factor (sigma-70 family)